MGIRCFFAIPLSGDAARSLASLRRAVTEAEPGWAGEKWVRSEHLHITLRFMPDVPTEDVDRLVGEVRTDLSHTPGFDIAMGRLEARPRAASARMLWVRAEDRDAGLPQIWKRIGDRTARYEEAAASRRFVGHVTLCRARRPRAILHSTLEALSPARSTSEQGVLTMSVSSVTLLASTLGPDGPTYRPLAEIPLDRV